MTYQSVLPNGKSFSANAGTKVAVLLEMNRCDSFPLLSAPHSLSLASEQTLKDLKRSQGLFALERREKSKERIKYGGKGKRKEAVKINIVHSGLYEVKNNSNDGDNYDDNVTMTMCAQGQVLHCKLRLVLLGMDRCGSFPLLSASRSLFSI